LANPIAATTLPPNARDGNPKFVAFSPCEQGQILIRSTGAAMLGTPLPLYERMIKKRFATIVSWDATTASLQQSIRRGADFSRQRTTLEKLGALVRSSPEQLVLLSTVQELNLLEIPKMVDFAARHGSGLILFNMVREIDGSSWMVMDALEMDEYWTVCREIEDVEKVDVFHVAQALDKFGLTDLAFIDQQTKRRTEFLDHLDKLATDPNTTEKQMHTSLQNSLWVFGSHYSLMASNQQLQRTVEDYTKKAYTDVDAADRPDLLLAANVESRHLLVEFKRPSIAVGRDAENQAKKYADTLTGRMGIGLEILIVGGEVDPKLQH
jgi:hypothetical protein